MSAPVVRARGVDKRFDDTRALDLFDLDVERATIVGFVGPNGSGKSTFLRVLVGLVRPDDGDLRVLGLDPLEDSLRIRRACCYLPGETSLYQNMTGHEFVDFAVGFYGARNDLTMAGELFDLPLDQRVRSFSAGMKQKLALLATLTPNVDLYLLDEPDRALDATARLQLRELLRELRARGKSILLSSHHLAEIDALADSTAFMFSGRRVEDDRVAEARRLLRREVRLRVAPDTDIPDGTELVEHQPDGSLRIRTTGEPLEWLARIPSERVDSVEVGATRLEDLYRVIDEDLAASGPGARP